MVCYFCRNSFWLWSDTYSFTFLRHKWPVFFSQNMTLDHRRKRRRQVRAVTTATTTTLTTTTTTTRQVEEEMVYFDGKTFTSRCTLPSWLPPPLSHTLLTKISVEKNPLHSVQAQLSVLQCARGPTTIKISFLFFSLHDFKHYKINVST